MSALTFTTATTVDEAVAALAAGARPVAGRHRPRRRRARREVDAAGKRRRDPPHCGASRRRVRATAACISARSRATPRSPRATMSARASRRCSDACAIVGSHATRAQGTVGGNVMNASPAMETGGPLVCFGATATLRSPSGNPLRRGRGSVGRAGQDGRRAGRAPRRNRHPRAGSGNGQRLSQARVPAPDGDRRRRRDGRRDARRRPSSPRPASR